MYARHCSGLHPRDRLSSWGLRTQPCHMSGLLLESWQSSERVWCSCPTKSAVVLQPQLSSKSFNLSFGHDW